MQLPLLPLIDNMDGYQDNATERDQDNAPKKIVIGNKDDPRQCFEFDHLTALKKKVKQIMTSRSDGQRLNPEGRDFLLMYMLLQAHPHGVEKARDLVGIKVDKSLTWEGKSCFFVVKKAADATVEKFQDFSMKKIFAALEASEVMLLQAMAPRVAGGEKKGLGDSYKTPKNTGSSAKSAKNQCDGEPVTAKKTGFTESEYSMASLDGEDYDPWFPRDSIKKNKKKK